MRAFVMIADAIFRNQCAKTILKTADDRRPDTARGDASGDDDRIDPLAYKKGNDGRLEKDRRPVFDDGPVVIGS